MNALWRVDLIIHVEGAVHIACQPRIGFLTYATWTEWDMRWDGVMGGNVNFISIGQTNLGLKTLSERENLYMYTP